MGSNRPGTGKGKAPEIPVAWGNVVNDTLRVDNPAKEAARLRRELSLGDGRTDYGRVLEALDKSAANHDAAGRLHRAAKANEELSQSQQEAAAFARRVATKGRIAAEIRETAAAVVADVLSGLDAIAERTAPVLDQVKVYRRHAFTLARASNKRLIEEVRKQLLDFLEGDGTKEQFLDYMERASPNFTRAYAETVARNAANTAYSAGRLQEARKLAPKLKLNWKYLTAGDERVRDRHAYEGAPYNPRADHRQYNGVVFPFTPEGLEYMPPNDHQ